MPGGSVTVHPWTVSVRQLAVEAVVHHPSQSPSPSLSQSTRLMRLSESVSTLQSPSFASAMPPPSLSVSTIAYFPSPSGSNFTFAAVVPNSPIQSHWTCSISCPSVRPSLSLSKSRTFGTKSRSVSFHGSTSQPSASPSSSVSQSKGSDA